MREEDNHHYTAIRPTLGLLGWEIMALGGLAGYQFCQYADKHWLYGVLIALLIAGVLLALLGQPVIRKVVFAALAVAIGVVVALLLQLWVDTFIGVVFGLIAGCAAYYWHQSAYAVFEFGHKVRQRTKERERYLDVRDEFERL